jgi:hypothetical protein
MSRRNSNEAAAGEISSPSITQPFVDETTPSLLSPEEGLRLMQAFLSIVNPERRRVAVNRAYPVNAHTYQG